MRDKSERTPPMVTADEARAQVRPDLCALVEHFCASGHPKMRAYRRVGDRIGRSAAWIQRVLGRDDDATVGLHDAINIQSAYERLCVKVEAAADAAAARNTRVREMRHAADEGAPAPRPGEDR